MSRSRIVQRWNYLKTRAVRDRHWEELMILDREMMSVPQYMQFRALKWAEIVRVHTSDGDEGLRCYAKRQGSMWWKFKHDAEVEFAKLNASRLQTLGTDSFAHPERLERLRRT